MCIVMLSIIIGLVNIIMLVIVSVIISEESLHHKCTNNFYVID